MKGYNYWSYTPYKPLLWEIGDIYICRIAPNKNVIHFEWLNTDDESYTVYYREKNNGEYKCAGETKDNEFDIVNLKADTDYEFFVQSGNKKSRKRIARTGETVGTVVNYLHPEDDVYAFSGRSLCSPSMVKHPDGYWLASMDVYEAENSQNLTLIFRSDDEGESWKYVSELMPCFWGKLFIHKNELYMLSCSTEYGDLLIGKSIDGGKTFSAPVSLLRGSNGKKGNVGVHKNPQNIVCYNGRIYGTLEWGSWANTEYYHAVMVMSCDVDDDLLVPENWSFSEPVKYNNEWEGVAKDGERGNIEGTLAVAPDGNLYNIMRYSTSEKLIIAYKVNTKSYDAALEFSHVIDFPGNLSKFMIKYDEISKCYYTIASRRTDTVDNDNTGARNLLSLMTSKDLVKWELKKDLIDKRNEDSQKVGFQYIDFEFVGNDIVFLSRTAMNNAHNFHDANYSTFHRIENFRNI